MFPADNKEISSASKENMPYPRFTKVVINHFISKDKTISMRNMISLYTIRDGTLLGTLKFVSKTQDYQQSGALIPNEMINQVLKDFKDYKTYLDFATGKETPKKASGDDEGNDDDSDKVTKDDADDDDVDSDADGDKEASDSEKTNSDEDKNPNLNQNDDEEEKYEEEYIRTLDSFEFTEDDEEYEELYKDVNVRLKETEHEVKGKRDEGMTDVGRESLLIHITFTFNSKQEMDQQNPTLPKYQSWTQENSSYGSLEYNNIFNMSIMPCGRSDLDTMSLDDLYNHLKVYESEVQKKSELNSQNMAFISSVKHSRGNEDVNTASVSTASTNVPTVSANIGVASISQDTVCAYIASQSSGSQIKFEDINQIGEDDMEEIDIKWSMALLSMRADKRDNYIQGSKVEEQAPKALMAIDEVGWDWCYMANDEEDHALVGDEEAPTEFALMANTSAKSKELETLKKEKKGVDGKLAGFFTASKDLDNLIESQRSDKNKDGLGYSVVPPPHAQIYSSSKKDMSWTGLLEFADDTLTDYSMPSPTIESTSGDDQNKNPFVTKTEASPSTISPKPFIKFVKAAERSTTNKEELTKLEQLDVPIVRVQRLERELKARTPIHKVDRGRSSDEFPLPEEVPTARVILPLLVQKSFTASEEMFPLLS
uniref:Uncharacterized protein n=1 Tax=Tanacetum cinerariifolium TaxID=118510 RepID=A0A6L2LHL3_TANCI|nr:hypothetical protein [Tanacetum cinerariifolium]